jgi:hypothetical protein
MYLLSQVLCIRHDTLSSSCVCLRWNRMKTQSILSLSLSLSLSSSELDAWRVMLVCRLGFIAMARRSTGSVLALT